MRFSTPDGYSHVLELHMEESYVELGFENTQAASLNCDIFFPLSSIGAGLGSRIFLCANTPQ